MKTLFDILFPPRCCVCEGVGAHLCEVCRAELTSHILYGEPPLTLRKPHGGGTFSLYTTCAPNPILQRTVHAFKYTYNEALRDALGRLMVRRITDLPFPREISIVPVPLHRSRLRERGFNQSFLLADYIASRMNTEGVLPQRSTTFHVADILQRNRITFPQAQLSRSDRLKNVSGAFSLKAGVITSGELPKAVMLIDDIVTTGSTITECQGVLQEAGVEHIIILALSHGLS